jgi:hypothetical protein
LEGGGVIFDPYRKVINFDKREGRAIGRAYESFIETM